MGPVSLCRPQGRCKQSGVGQHSLIESVPDATGKSAQAIRWERQPVAGTMLTHPGVYCLRTNELTWDAERLWRTYVTLTDLEAVFRSLKSELGLRPVYRRTEERVDGHLFVTVLAYRFEQVIRRRLRARSQPGRGKIMIV
jgi:transposase